MPATVRAFFTGFLIGCVSNVAAALLVPGHNRLFPQFWFEVIGVRYLENVAFVLPTALALWWSVVTRSVWRAVCAILIGCAIAFISRGFGGRIPPPPWSLGAFSFVAVLAASLVGGTASFLAPCSVVQGFRNGFIAGFLAGLAYLAILLLFKQGGYVSISHDEFARLTWDTFIGLLAMGIATGCYLALFTLLSGAEKGDAARSRFGARRLG
jgi:hypothetical protein